VVEEDDDDDETADSFESSLPSSEITSSRAIDDPMRADLVRDAPSLSWLSLSSA
jgi:hypothetical protein